MGKKTSLDKLTAKELAERAGITVHQVNDYAGRNLLVTAGRDGRARLFSDPPSSDVVAAIQRFLDEHGNLNGCLRSLRERWPEYYR